MAITIHLSPETEEQLRRRAAERGQTVDGYLRQLVERDVGGASGHGPSPETSVLRPSLPSDDALAPFRREVVASGMSDEELLRFFADVREEIYRDKRGRPGDTSCRRRPPSTPACPE
jgi:hypothetical protein